MKKLALVFLFILSGMSLMFPEKAKTNSQTDAYEYEEDGDDYDAELKELSRLSPKELAELLSTEENENFITLYALTLIKEGFDADKNIPQVTEKRFKEILKEIVNLESKIQKKIKKSGYEKKDGYAYQKAFGNTFLVNLKADTPYAYHKIQNPEPANGLNNFISVIYTRPSRKGYIIFTGLRLNLDSSVSEELDLDGETFAEIYKECEESSTFTTSLKIAGKEYTVFFQDIEDDLE